jgi:hypothetical protein
MGDIVLAGSTSGTTTLTPTAVSGTTTLTLPATTGTVALTASPTFTGQATIPTINLTGGQIAFPATQSASADANTLDDYEEGSWTPALTTPGTATYTAQTGRYIKIGKFVWVQGNLQINTIGTGAGAQVSGLPYLIGAVLCPITFGYFSGLVPSVVYLSGYINASQDITTFTTLGAAGVTVNNGVVILTSGTNIYFSAWYQAAS